MMLVDMWKKIQHSNSVTLREVFTTKAFGDHCECLAYRNNICRSNEALRWCLLILPFDQPFLYVFVLQRWCSPTISMRVQKPCSAGTSMTQQQTRTLPRGSGVSWSSFSPSFALKQNQHQFRFHFTCLHIQALLFTKLVIALSSCALCICHFCTVYTKPLHQEVLNVPL